MASKGAKLTVFNTGMNDVTRKYFLKTPNENEYNLGLTFTSDYNNALADILEQFLFFDKVSIKVYGENITLTVLINELGVNNVFSLIEEGAIEFLLWTPTLTTMVDDTFLGVMQPLQPGILNSTTHKNPDESINAGLKFMKVQPDRTKRREIERKVGKIYKLPKQNFAHDSVELIYSAYTSNKLASAGLPNEKELNRLNYNERQKLLKFGEGVLETAILADFKYTSIGNYQYYDVSSQSIGAIKAGSKVLDGIGEILKTESLPDIKQLILERKISLKDVVDFRRKSTSKKFRQWMVSTLDDSEYITKQYIEEIANHKGYFETPKGKFIKTVGVYGVGLSVGAVIEGAPGALAGVGVSALLKPIGELGLSFIDAYLLDKLLKGWQPRMFINEYEKLMKKKKG